MAVDVCAVIVIVIDLVVVDAGVAVGLSVVLAVDMLVLECHVYRADL